MYEKIQVYQGDKLRLALYVLGNMRKRYLMSKRSINTFYMHYSHKYVDIKMTN